MFDLPDLQERLSRTLSPARYRHSLAVMELARELAEVYGADPAEAAVAGLLHDVAREMEPGRLLALADEWGLTLCEIDRRVPVLLHGIVGAELLRREWNLENPRILTAVAQHITGGPVMSLLSQVVFIADYAEPGRKFPASETARLLAREDRVKALKFIINRGIKYVLNRGFLIHPLAIEAWNQLAAEGDLKPSQEEQGRKKDE
jgi:predicted HD superfamily hydrolase involved in NAD metabolism